VTGGAITGRVTGADPAAQVVGVVTRRDGVVDGFAQAAADGTYRIDGLLAGAHTVCFAIQVPFAPTGGGCVEANVVAGQVTEGVDGQVS
jgi:hypothetical protein